MREEFPAEGGLNREGRVDTTTATPAAAAQAGAPALPSGQEVKTKWTEFCEKEKRAYIIEIYPERMEENEVVYRKMRLEVKWFPIYPYGNYVATVWELEWDGADEIRLSKRVVRDSWNGTGVEYVGEVAVNVVLPETPWYYDYEELTATVEEQGARQVIEWILDDIENLVKEVTGGGEEE